VESSLGPLKTVSCKIVANVRFARLGGGQATSSVTPPVETVDSAVELISGITPQNTGDGPGMSSDRGKCPKILRNAGSDQGIEVV
jgi:hypothetical protein